jgi:hypothetical protein
MLLTKLESGYLLQSKFLSIPVIADTPSFELWTACPGWDKLTVVLSDNQGRYSHTAEYGVVIRKLCDRIGLSAQQEEIILDPRSCVSMGNGMLIHHGTKVTESRGCLLVDGRQLSVTDSQADIPVALFNALPTHVSLYRRARTVMCTLLLASFFKTVS